MGWLLAFREAPLSRVAREVTQVVATHDTETWRRIWPRLQYSWSPFDYQLKDWKAELLAAERPALAELGAEVMPQPGSKQLQHLLRALARGAILHRAELVESKWHVHYPELSDDVAGCELEASEEYEALGDHVFTAGPMPSGLEFLDESPNVTTNWITAAEAQSLWQLEMEEGFLKTAGDNMTRQHLPLGTDFLTLRGVLEIAALADWSVYLWDPGT